MASEIGVIETGVDKLVKIVKERGRIAMADITKELGVSPVVIQEWVNFLEEEGILTVEYKLTKPFLVDRKLTKKEVEAKAKEFEGKKDVFVRKAEFNLSSLEKQAQDLKKIKGEFDKLKNELGFELDKVRNDLKELEKYQQLKVELQKDIDLQKSQSKMKMDDMTKEISREQKKYEEFILEVRKEKEEISKEKKEAKSLEDTEKILFDRLGELKSTISSIEKKILSEGEAIKNSEMHIDKLNQLMENVKQHVEEEKLIIDNLVSKSKEHEDKAAQIQESIIKKITSNQKNFDSVNEITKKVNDFFSKKLSLVNLVEKVNKDRDELEKSLIELIRKAKSFELSSRSGNVANDMVDLEKKFNEVDKKKENFEKELKDLASFFKN